MYKILRQILIIQDITLINNHREGNTLFKQLNDQIFPQRTKNIKHINHKQVMSAFMMGLVSVEDFVEDVLSVKIETTLVDLFIVLFG